MAKSSANITDVHIGRRIRLRRQELEMSQQTLGEKLGLTFQQVQKYEKGTNRVGGSRLYQLAKALRVGSVDYFYEGLAGLGTHDRPTPDTAHDFMGQPKAMDLMQAFNALPLPMQHSVVTLAQDLVKGFVRPRRVSVKTLPANPRC